MSRVFVAMFMVYVMTPGAGEFTENVVHFAMNGHAAHAIDDGKHAPQGQEHDCSGPYHMCACHTSAVFVMAGRCDGLGIPAGFLAQPVWYLGLVHEDGVFTNVFRPPIA